MSQEIQRVASNPNIPMNNLIIETRYFERVGIRIWTDGAKYTAMFFTYVRAQAFCTHAHIEMHLLCYTIPI